MKVPFLDLQIQLPVVRSRIEQRMANIIDGAAFTSGEEVREFEGTFAPLHGYRYAVALSSGTAANHLALELLDIGPGDEVILPANTFIATAEGISLTGATPVFVDVDAGDFNLDVNRIEAAITAQTKAIIAVHLFGQPANLPAIREIAARHSLQVVEDAAQAHLATFPGARAPLATWSFYPAKNLGAWGEAGAITMSEEALFVRAMKYRNHGSSEKYRHDVSGHNYRMDEFQAAVLNVKLQYLEEWTSRRRANAALYRQYLREIPQVTTPSEKADFRHVYHLFVIRVPDRDDLMASLAQREIGTGIHYPVPLHLTPAFSHLGYKPDDFPVAKMLAGEVLSLPLYPELAERQIEYVCDAIREHYR